MSKLSLSLLGPFSATLDGRPLTTFRTRSVQALLIYLAVESDRAQSRESLMTLLWPDILPSSAQTNLRQTLYRLRKLIPEVEAKDGQGTVPFLLTTRQSIGINPDAAFELDIARFRELIDTDPETAVSLYRDDFLCDFYLPGSNAFEEWVADQRAQLCRLMLDGLDALADHHLNQKQYDQALTYAWRQLEIDDLRETAYRQLMIALTRTGQRTAALAQYQLARRRLRNELRVEPSEELSTLYEQIQADALRASQPQRTGQQPETAKPQTVAPVFLFTDIEGSTPLWDTHREGMLAALMQHNIILQEQIARHDGRILELRGDGVKAVFEDVNPLPCVLDIQRAFGQADWGTVGEVRIRIGLHGAPASEAGHDYFLKGDQYYGPALHQAARIMDAGWGGQILVSDQVRDAYPLPPGASWRNFGSYRFRGIDDPLRIFGLVHPGLRYQDFPPLRVPAVEPHPAAGLAGSLSPISSLPSQPTHFIGREEELEELDTLISEPDARLVTIVGPGGMGKTRLALAFAERVIAANGDRPLRDGTYFVNLAPLEEADQIVPALADALSLRLERDEQEARTPKEQVLDYLRQKQLLLILDNYEQFLHPQHMEESVGLVTEILTTAPKVRVLVTSRERLHLHTEQAYPIQGLDFPDWETPEDAAEYTAVQLFLQAARRIRPGFELTSPDDLKHMSRICRLVGGMPLALELAAGWVDVLSLAEIAAEIERSLDFLETELQDVPQRHRGIRAILNQSWARLDDAERRVLARFSVFRGGCTRQAAQVVTGASLRMLANLAGKSLIQFRQSDGDGHGRQQGRYQMHELLRHFAAENLALQDEGSMDAWARHAAFYCRMLERLEKELNSERQLTAVAEITADYENVRAAWNWAIVEGDLELLASAAASLATYLDARGRWGEGEQLFKQAVAQMQIEYGSTPEVPANARRLAWLVGWQYMFHDDFGPHWEESLRHCLTLVESAANADEDTAMEEGLIRLMLGHHLRYRGSLELAEEGKQHLKTSLRLFRQSGNDLLTTDALMELFYYALANGESEESQQLLNESMTLLRQIGEPRRMVWWLRAQGDVSRYDLQDYDDAMEKYAQAYAAAQASDQPLSMASALTTSGFLAWFLGDFERALSDFQQALNLSQQMGSRQMIAFCLSNIGMTHAYRGHFSLARAALDGSLEIQSMPNSYSAFVHLHAGEWADAEKIAQDIANMEEPDVGIWGHRALSWLKLVAGKPREALACARQAVAASVVMQHPTAREWEAWSRVPLGLAQYRLDHRDEAKAELYQSLHAAVQSRAYLPLMHLMPVIPVVLAGEGKDERALEVAALAQTLPFVANSRMFPELAGKNLDEAAKRLPADVVAAAKSMGARANCWETAETLLAEFEEWGWGE